MDKPVICHTSKILFGYKASGAATADYQNVTRQDCNVKTTQINQGAEKALHDQSLSQKTKIKPMLLETSTRSACPMT